MKELGDSLNGSRPSSTTGSGFPYYCEPARIGNGAVVGSQRSGVRGQGRERGQETRAKGQKWECEAGSLDSCFAHGYSENTSNEILLQQLFTREGSL